MYTGKTASGFEFKVQDTALDNMELIDAIAAVEEEPLALSSVVQLLLGTEEKKRLYSHLRREAGNVPVDAVSQELMDILAACGDEGKN